MTTHPGKDHLELSGLLIPIDDNGGCLVFGELPTGLDLAVEPVPYFGQQETLRLSEALMGLSGGINVLAQIGQAGALSAGLVRLAPQTLTALGNGATFMQSGGLSLGTLMHGGSILGPAAFVPAGAVGLAPALATIGPALALLAVQMQLTKISRSVQQNIQLTQTVLDELREEWWHELAASSSIVLDSVREAERLGAVTPAVWAHLEAQAPLAILTKHRQRNMDALQRRLAALPTSGSAAGWYQKNYADVLRFCQAIMVAQQGLALYQLLRVAATRLSDAPQDQSLADHLLAESRRRHDETAALVGSTLQMLHRSLSLWYEAEPGKKLAVLGREQVSLTDLRETVAQLHSRAAAAAFRQLDPIPAPRAITALQSVDVQPRDRLGIEHRLRWVLDPDESLLLLGRGSYRFGDGETRHLLVVTGRRALLVDSDELSQGRAVFEELPPDVEFSRLLKDGYETVELKHEGHVGSLRTKTDHAIAFTALTHLRDRVAHQRRITSEGKA
jgi:hypothetical protein